MNDSTAEPAPARRTGEPADVGLMSAGLELLPDIITICEAVRGDDGAIVDIRLRYQNAAARAAQPGGDEALDRLGSELWPESITNGALDACIRVLDSGVTESGSQRWDEEDRYRVGGYDWMATRIAPDLMLWIKHDDTERLRLIEELRENEERANEASRAKSDFLSSMSHELRTPLNAILGFAQLLGLSELDGEQADNVELIMQAGEHLLGLVDDLLDISRIEHGQLDLDLRVIPVAEVVDHVVTLVGPLARTNGVTIEPPAIDGSATVQADRRRFVQIVLNLVTNAVKYHRLGGRVTVEAQEADDEVAVVVTDDGPGIAADDLARIFVPFARFAPHANRIEGSGMGLPLSLGLAEAMGGRIEARSTPGHGSTFSVVLPRPGAPRPAPGDDIPDDTTSPSDQATQATDQATAHVTDRPTDGQPGRTVGSITGSPTGPTPGNARVVCFEDDAANLALVRRVLEMAGSPIELVGVHHAEGGAALVRRLQPAVVLLDLGLPPAGGAHLLSELRADPATAAVPVVVCSGETDEARVSQLRAQGVSAYLTKPLDLRVLLDTVQRFIGDAPRSGGASGAPAADPPSGAASNRLISDGPVSDGPIDDATVTDGPISEGPIGSRSA